MANQGAGGVAEQITFQQSKGLTARKLGLTSEDNKITEVRTGA